MRSRGLLPLALPALLALSACGGAGAAEDLVPTTTDAGGDDALSPPSGGPDGDAAIDPPPSSEAGATDAGSGCSLPGALLCDDLESGGVDPTRWTVESKNATLTVDKVHASNGASALHAHVQGLDNSVAYLHPVGMFPVAGNHLFGRAMIYVADALPVHDYVVFEAAGALADGTEARYGVGGINGANGQVFRLAYHPGDLRELSTSHPPIGHWACWEWEMDGANDVMRVWLNGGATPEAVAMHETPPWNAPTFRKLSVGYSVPHADPRPAFDMWLDQVVIGTARIGCPP